MYNRTENLRTDIEEARRKIGKLFLGQCQDGAQSKELGNDSYACGQFLNAHTKSQRGIHGTAAALYVLGCDDTKEVRELVCGLVHYAEKRCELEKEHNGADEEKCRQDERNVIKTAELLLALKRAKPVVAKEDLLNGLAGRLKKSMLPQGCWTYFTDSDDTQAYLPTAYASAALRAFGYTEEAKKSGEYIHQHLKRSYVSEPNRHHPALVDLTIDVFCLYVLTFENPVSDSRSDLAKIFAALWKRLRALIETGSEQNLEYWYEEKKSCYIRVPWELYMIALSSHYAFPRSFSSSRVQRRLGAILRGVLDSGFLYSHSGRHISARTNAILFEVLGRLAEKLADRELSSARVAFDGMAALWRWSPFRWVVRVALGLFVLYIFWAWLRSDRSLAELCPELLGPILLAVLTWKPQA